MHAHTHKVHHEAVSEVHNVNYTGPLSKLCPPSPRRPGFMVTHSESQSLYLGGGVDSAVTGPSVKTKAEWPPCECTWQAHLAEIQSDSGVSMGGDSLISFN